MPWRPINVRLIINQKRGKNIKRRRPKRFSEGGGYLQVNAKVTSSLSITLNINRVAVRLVEKPLMKVDKPLPPSSSNIF